MRRLILFVFFLALAVPSFQATPQKRSSSTKSSTAAKPKATKAPKAPKPPKPHKITNKVPKVPKEPKPPKPAKATKTSASLPARSSSATLKSTPAKSTVAARDSQGKIKRSAAARNAFMKQTGYPKGRKGYVVDHIIPLECGGADTPANMQWQTVEAAKIKDRTERNCRQE